MSVRKASAVWQGGLKDGRGKATFTGFEGSYSFPSRFEEGDGTNPEEMIGAALASCFSMALSANLEKAGHKPEEVKTTASVHLEKGGEGFSITRIDLATEVKASGLDEATLREEAGKAKSGCPISRALSVPEINLDARLG